MSSTALQELGQYDQRACCAVVGDPAVGDLLTDYLRALQAFPVLAAEHEVALARAIEAGVLAQERLAGAVDPQRRAELEAVAVRGGQAREILVAANLRLVVAIARRYRNRGVELVELIAEGNLGLLRAIEGFDYGKGCRFSTYAIWWIRQGVLRALLQAGRAVRLPAGVAADVAEVQHARQRFAQQHGRPPTHAELVAAVGLPAAAVDQLLLWEEPPVSLDVLVPADGSSRDDDGSAEYVRMVDLVVDPAPDIADVVASRALPDQVARLLAGLAPLDAAILNARFGLSGDPPQSLREVALRYRLSVARVRQIEARALQMLAHASRAGQPPRPDPAVGAAAS